MITASCKKYLLLFLFITSTISSFAGHIAGGEIFYEYLGPGAPNNDRFRITIRLFRECVPPAGGQPIAELPTFVRIGIMNNTNPSTYYQSQVDIQRSGFQTLTLGSPNPCISSPPPVCYQVGIYAYETDLPTSASGYVVAFQTCCRTNSLSNVVGTAVGATYTAVIPGTNTLNNLKNSSAVFSLKDTTLICKNSSFLLDFSATDPDGDSLSYAFCAAYNGGPATNSGAISPSLPPYGNIGYGNIYSGNSPLGTGVSINPRTGIISGVSPNAGSYVVNVCVSEWRSGQLISVHRKDFTLKIGDCSLSGAELQPEYITCDGYTLTFSNQSTSSNITGYSWNFGDPRSGTNNVATTPVATHTYSDTGVYVLKLKVSNTTGCTDSATANVKVYPGFFPNFDVVGSCFQTPFQFIDRTTTAHGVVDTWRWDFGDQNTNADTSRIRNPSYQYATSGQRTATLIVTNSKGCIDTITRPVVVNDVPSLTLPFKDTLICSIDTLQLQALGSGSFSWTPNYNISSTTASSPFVNPHDTTRYIVTLNENGCVKRDTITVNVLHFITVDAGRDTSMCLTDSIFMRPVSHALSYIWTPSTGLSDPNTKNPVLHPVHGSTTYYLTANLGKCQDRDSVTVHATPYPQANAGPDVTICYGDRTPITATIVGSSYHWTPANSLMNPGTLTPVAGPMSTTNYVLTVFDTLGCPKPYRDTLQVTVRPQVQAFAGRDTVIVANQPLQLNATGGATYLWSPATGMDDPTKADPIITLGPNYDELTYVVRVTDAAGCFADDDIRVKVFKTGPDIFVPTAFTPNADGRNDILRPIPVGIRSLNFFRVYNRWGQMVYSTSEVEKGWDGTLGGKAQGSGTYIYVVEAIDYTGKTVFKKGTAVLIR